MNLSQELELKQLTEDEWQAFYERWLRELPEKRRRTREALDRLRRIAEGRDRR